MMLNCPRPGSLLLLTAPVPPPPSCSPFSGKSSSKTNTESFEGGNGVRCDKIVTGANVPVQVVAFAAGVQTDGIGAPPMPCPQVPPPDVEKVQSLVMSNGLCGPVGSFKFIGTGAPPPLANGSPASPGSTEM